MDLVLKANKKIDLNLYPELIFKNLFSLKHALQDKNLPFSKTPLM